MKTPFAKFANRLIWVNNLHRIGLEVQIAKFVTKKINPDGIGIEKGCARATNPQIVIQESNL